MTLRSEVVMPNSALIPGAREFSESLSSDFDFFLSAAPIGWNATSASRQTRETTLIVFIGIDVRTGHGRAHNRCHRPAQDNPPDRSCQNFDRVGRDSVEP